MFDPKNELKGRSQIHTHTPPPSSPKKEKMIHHSPIRDDLSPHNSRSDEHEKKEQKARTPRGARSWGFGVGRKGVLLLQIESHDREGTHYLPVLRGV